MEEDEKAVLAARWTRSGIIITNIHRVIQDGLGHRFRYECEGTKKYHSKNNIYI